MASDRLRAAGIAVPAALGGAACQFFLDPERGRGRRAHAAQRLGGLRRRLQRRGERVARHAATETAGMAQRATHPQWSQSPPPDDVTLTRKVESEIFRDPDVPKGSIVVNAEHGVVFLRGSADDSERVRELERQTRSIPGVRDVEVLLSTSDSRED